MRLRKTRPTPPSASESRETHQSVDGFGQWSKQDVSLRNIDPAKLAEKLRLLFDDSYEVQMRHSIYCIRAPRSLSESESADCRLISDSPHEDARQLNTAPWRAWGRRMLFPRLC
ncbi:hypothetical protein VTI74DRAFT_8611 [Chaetomium olivicolor]